MTLQQKETREEWRQRIFREAEELQLRHSESEQQELLEKISRLRLSILRHPDAPDSVDLIREDRER